MVEQIIANVINFFSDYDISFETHEYGPGDMLVFVRSQPPLLTLDNIDINPLVSKLKKLIPGFSKDDIILYSNGDIGIIMRPQSEEEKISELPLEMYVNLTKSLNIK